MTLSRRETVIAVIAALAVALLVSQRYIISPLRTGRADLEYQHLQLTHELEESARVFEQQRRMARRWQEMTAGGLASDPSTAEGRILQAVRDWAQQAGLALTSVQPERSRQEDTLGEIIVTASGTGRMSAVSRFLWLAETTALPLRVQEIQLGARTDGEDDLSLQLKLSTLYAAGSLPEAAGTGGAP